MLASLGAIHRAVSAFDEGTRRIAMSWKNRNAYARANYDTDGDITHAKLTGRLNERHELLSDCGEVVLVFVLSQHVQKLVSAMPTQRVVVASALTESSCDDFQHVIAHIMTMGVIF